MKRKFTIAQMIQKEYRDVDGYWIELRPGFVVKDDGCHGIVENTKREARWKLDLVVACVCDECNELKRAATKGGR